MNEQKKYVIAFDAKRLFTNYTGLGNYSRTLVRNLAIHFPDYEYHLFTPRMVRNAETEWFLDSGRFTVHLPKYGGLLWRPLLMAKEVNALNPDIFHGLSHEIPFGLRSDIRTFVTFHDLIYLLYPRQFGLWDRWMYRLKYASSARRAGTVIAISKSTAQDVQAQYGLPGEKVKVVYQSCQDVFQNPTTGAVTAPAGLPADPYFLYVGSLIPRKGLDRIVLALAGMAPEKRKKVVVVGSGKGSFIRRVQALIAKYDLQTYFHFIPQVTNAELVALYDRSYALLYPSMYEGFGIPIIESLFRSKPVITSSTSSMPEAAGPGAIFVHPDNILDLKEAMEHIQDKTVYVSLATAGKSYVTNRFGSFVTAEKMMEVYFNNTVRMRPSGFGQ